MSCIVRGVLICYLRLRCGGTTHRSYALLASCKPASHEEEDRPTERVMMTAPRRRHGWLAGGLADAAQAMHE